MAYSFRGGGKQMQQSILSSTFILVIAQTLLQYDDPRTVHAQEITTTRVSTINTFNLKCQIGAENKPKDAVRTIKNVDFDYWYAVGSTGVIDPIKMFNIEQLLYNSVEDDMVWCWEDIDDNEDPPSSATDSDAGRKLQTALFATEMKQQSVPSKKFKRRATAEQSRILGIVTFTPGTMDKETSLKCPSILDDLIAATKTSQCTVIQGTMRIVAHTDDDLRYATASIRDGLQGAMTAGLGQNSELSGINFFSYLGDTEEEVLALITGGRPGSVVGEEGSGSNGNKEPSVDGSGSDGGDTAISDVKENAAAEDDDKGIVILFAVGIPVLAAFLLAVLLHRKERNNVTRSTYFGLRDHEYVLPGTADPPGSFHQGLYHYMKNGQSYLSTNCELCYETRRQMLRDGLFGDDINYLVEHDLDSASSSDDTPERNNLATILENETFDKTMSDDDEVLLRATPDRKLNQIHMGLDVHKCTSSTCKRCHPAQGFNQVPTFLSRLGSSTCKDSTTKNGSQVVFSNAVFSDEIAEV